MSLLDDQFDLDIRLAPVGRPLTPRADDLPDTGGWDCYSLDPSCGQTCACSTVETCNQQLEDCGYPFTYPGNYCEDETDGCGDPGTQTCDCPDDPTDECETETCVTSAAC